MTATDNSEWASFTLCPYQATVPLSSSAQCLVGFFTEGVIAELLSDLFYLREARRQFLGALIDARETFRYRWICVFHSESWRERYKN